MKAPYSEGDFARTVGFLRPAGAGTEILIPSGRFQRAFPDFRELMRNLKKAGKARTEGGKRPKLTIKDRAGSGCGYSKLSRTCAEPDHFGRCPLPSHDLRNGRLNQTAYALYLFIRDLADKDLIGWIDERLQAADAGPVAFDERKSVCAKVVPSTNN